ncbi:hypothetical protein [Persephonella sp.]
MIILGDPREQQAQRFYQGFLNSLNFIAQQKMKEDFMNEQFQNQLKRLNTLYDLQTEKAKELAKYKIDLENEQRKRLVNELLGQQQAQVNNLNQAFDVGDIRQDILTGIDRAKQQGFDLFGAEGGMLDKAVKNIPKLNLPKPDVKTKYQGGILSELANKNPLIADSIKAQVYGVRLPQIKQEKKKFEAKVIDNQYFTFDPETGEWIKQGELKKVLKETPQRLLVDTGDKKLLIDKKNGQVIKEYAVNKDKSGSKSGAGKGSPKFSQYFSKFLNLRKQLRMLETGRIINEYGMVIPIPEDKRLPLRDQIIKDIATTLEMMKAVDPEKAKVLEEQIKKDLSIDFNRIYPYTPADNAQQNIEPDNKTTELKPKFNNNPFSVFEVK